MVESAFRTVLGDDKSRRRIGLGHFAFYRAYLEGSAEIDLPALADAYLNWGKDARQVSVLLRWLQDELAAAARRMNDREAVRLLRLPRSIGRAVARASEKEARLSDLSSFAADIDPDGVYSEQELIALYTQRNGLDGVRRRDDRKSNQAARLRERRLLALKRIEGTIAEAPQLTHAVGGWLEPNVAARLNAVGVTTVSELIDWIDRYGYRWYTRVPKVGGEGAARIVRWVQGHRASLKREILATALRPLGKLDSERLLSERAETDAPGAFTPLEAMRIPHALSGAQGINRAGASRNRSGTDDDLAAVIAWLSRQPADSDTFRSYRIHVERLLLWCVHERGVAMSSLSADDLDAYRQFLGAPGANWIRASRHLRRWQAGWRPFDGPLSLASIRTSIAVIRSMFSWMTKVSYLEGNPLELADQPTTSASRETPGALRDPDETETALLVDQADRTLSWAEWTSLKAYLETLETSEANERIRFAILLIAATGWRVGDLVAAQIGDLTQLVDRRTGDRKWTLRASRKGRGVQHTELDEAFMGEVGRYLASRELPVDPMQCDPTLPLLSMLRIENTVSGEQLDRMWLSRLISEALSAAGTDVSKASPAIGAKLSTATAEWIRNVRYLR